MKSKIHAVIFGILLSLITNAQTKPARLIIRGDDMGFSHAANEALIKTWKLGIERSIEVLVPSPWFPEAVKLLKENKDVDAGIHLALTSEWETVKWRPLTYCPSITDSNGYFYPMIWPNKNYPNKSLTDHPWKLDEIEKELRAQIELGLKLIPRISHLSSHMGYDRLDKEVTTLVKKLAKEYKLDIDPGELGVKYIGYKGASRTSAEKLASFLNMLDSLKPGETYLFVDHPALDGPEMRAIYHIGYENVAEDRQGVTDLFTNPVVIEAIKKRNIQLISYADLKK
ncbi:MAG: polysaccharide deacetylase family protein [Ginsengibacter sp.]